MADDVFPSYVHREQEQLILDLADAVRTDGQSRAALIYGEGGSGKTHLLRYLAKGNGTQAVRWVDPLDLDDPEYWLLGNLERKVVETLDPDLDHFGPYGDELSRLPAPRETMSVDQLLGRLRQVKGTFNDCYTAFVQATDAVPVIALDTVEAVRDTHLLITLTQWIKALPGTLFVLSSRPPSSPGADRLLAELEDIHQNIPVHVILLGGFSESAANDYLSAGPIGSALSVDDRAKLACLTRGHPLWLALAIEYLRIVGIPEELDEYSLSEIRRLIPYGEPLSDDASLRVEVMKRRLVTPYSWTDFWHDAVRRLAVVRESLNEVDWRALMLDRELPHGLSWAEAWQELIGTPWVRERANGLRVTLHDVLAEELNSRIVPLHDQDGSWRQGLWQVAHQIFLRRAETAGQLHSDIERSVDRNQDSSSRVAEVSELAVRKREADQARVAALHFEILLDRRAGYQRFLDQFDAAVRRNDVFLQELLVLEIQRFVTRSPRSPASEHIREPDVPSDRAHADEHRLYIEIVLRVAAYLTAIGQGLAALTMLNEIPPDWLTSAQRYRLNLRLGNATMRVPGRVTSAEQFFTLAHDLAASATEDHGRRMAEASKELGYYYRNVGRWSDAERAYHEAYTVITQPLPTAVSSEDREEMASVFTNWAYVKALSGAYGQAEGLIETALKVRQSLGRQRDYAISESVHGEILRYGRKFKSAWTAYERAHDIFQELSSWNWLGVIYQEQAICLHQAVQADFDLLVDDPVREAQDRIIWSLDICKDDARRHYPSALNRAGRIFGAVDAEQGLAYLSRGIDEARAVNDGWFYFANLIEYAELQYQVWEETRDAHRLTAIRQREDQIEEAVRDYEFADLEGRWRLLRAYVDVNRALDGGSAAELNTAVAGVGHGFELIATSHVGSHGVSALPHEFKRLRRVVERLPTEVREHWYEQLRDIWARDHSGDATLIARLQELYIEIAAGS